VLSLCSNSMGLICFSKIIRFIRAIEVFKKKKSEFRKEQSDKD